MLKKCLLIALTLFFFALLPARAQEAPAPEIKPVPALALHGAPKYGPDFTHFDYVNPDAPRGGALRLAALETFDNFNPYIVKGLSVAGIGLTTVTLTEQSADEPFSVYGAVAQSMEVPDDRSWIVFTIRPQAAWGDGKPITAQDVVWSFHTLMDKGQPFYRSYYTNVKDVQALSNNRVKFTFTAANNREMPLIVGQMPLLPEHYWTGKDFSATTLDPPVDNGPYKVGKVVPGRSVEYVRVKNWWGDNLPVFKGRYNFERITYDYYRDRNVELEAFFAGNYDFREEFTAKLWATGYDAPPVRDGRIAKKLIPNKLPQGMQGFVFNIRRPVFADRAVRRALDYAFDYDWANKQFAYGAYTRSRSYFSNTDMAATGLPAGREIDILEKYRGKIPDEVFTQEYSPAKTDGSGNNRDNLRQAAKILDEAGYVLGKDGVRVNAKTGVRLEFEFLTNSGNAAFDRWIMPFIQNLEKIGVKATFRVVDASQYVNRLIAFDYDMTVSTFGQSNSPGNEQREYWTSGRADVKGSRNYIGLKDPVIDALVENITAAPTREDLVAACRALDRVLQWGFYVIPNWHIPAWRVAYWDKFGQPAIQAPFALGVADMWWVKK